MKLSNFELIIELREYLRDQIATSYLSNYSLEEKNDLSKVNDYSEVKELKHMRDPSLKQGLIIKKEKYTEMKVRQHVARFKEHINEESHSIVLNKNEKVIESNSGQGNREQELTSNNPLLKSILEDQNEKQATPEVKTPHQFDNSFLLVNDDLMFLRFLWGNQTLYSSQNLQPLPFATKQHGLNSRQNNPLSLLKKQFQSANSYSAQIQLKDKLRVPHPNSSKLLKSLTLNSHQDRALLTRLEDRTSQIFVNKLEESQELENPIQSILIQKRSDGVLANDTQGELYRIEIQMKQDQLIEVKAHESGFIIEDQKSGKQFSAYTLPGVLSLVSPQFQQYFAQKLQRMTKSDPYKAMTIENKQSTAQLWYQSYQAMKDQRNEDLMSNQDYIHGYYGLDAKQGGGMTPLRDWNEEYQQCKELPKGNLLQRIQRKRTIQKVYYEFVENSKIGAVKIIEGNVQSLNPNDALEQQIFIYNNIFFSFCVDSPLDFSETINESIPTFSAVNSDFRGIQSLEHLDQDSFHTLATCFVSYMGRRIVCQSIIPGILSFVSQQTISEYGSSNNCKTIETNQEYHEKLTEVCKVIGVKSARVRQQEDQQVKEIAGSPEIKGVRGTDRRKYLIDLMRLFPRDSNYPQKTNHSQCMIRPEALKMFNMQRAQQYKGRYLGQSLKNLSKIKQPHEILVSFNNNLLTSVPLEEEIEQEVNDLKQLGDFVRNDAISSLIVESLSVAEGGPTDSLSLKNLFHQHGISMRYLGRVIEIFRRYCHEKSLKFKHIEFLLEKELFLRSLKHVWSLILSKTPLEYTQFVFVHLLNCVFSPHLILDLLDTGLISMDAQYIQKQRDIQLQKSTQVDKTCAETTQQENLDAIEKDIQQVQVKKKKKNKVKKPQEDENIINSSSSIERKEHANSNEKNNVILNLNSILNSSAKTSDSTERNSWSNHSTPGSQNSRRQSEEFSLEFDSKNSQVKFTKFDAEEYFTQDAQNIYFELQNEELPKTLVIKPGYLYEELVKVARERYSFNFASPSSEESKNENDLKQQIGFKDLSLLQSPADKLCIIRELCKSFGVTLEATDYFLDNQQTYCFTTNPSYDWLPFKASNIIQSIPLSKTISHSNCEIETLLEKANQAFKEHNYELSFDFYTQCVSIYIQIQGPLQKEAFECLQRMSRIIYLQGDLQLSINLQIKAINVAEALYGTDSIQFVYALSTLAMYLQQNQEFVESIHILKRVIDLLTLIEGENHTDIAQTYITLGYIYQDLDMLIEASDSFFESLQRFIDCIGEETIQVASCLSALAVNFFHMDELRKALEYQEKSHAILNAINLKFLSQPWCEPLQAQVYDQYLESSRELLNHYAQQCKQREKALILNQQQMTSRSYKRALGRQNNLQQPSPFAYHGASSSGFSFLDFLEYNSMMRSTISSAAPTHNYQRQQF